MVMVLCCKPGYGGCRAAVSPNLGKKQPSKGLISASIFLLPFSEALALITLVYVAGTLAWTQGGISIWTQRVRLPQTLQLYRGTGICRAGLGDDAPYAVAIADSVLSTLVLPVDTEIEEGHQTVSPLGGDDVRFAAMGIISFIPLFNWLVWVFAWLDTGKQRYLVYSIIYIAPYVRSGLSLSPEDSWLPIASVLACILHVQMIIQQRDPDPR